MFTIEQRVLAGIRFEDASTGAPIRQRLHLRGEGLSLFVNRRNIYVVERAVGLETHVHAFEAAPTPPPAIGELSFTVEVRDPSGMYLPRSFTLALPRSPEHDADDSVLQPVVVPLYRSPLAPSSPNWSLIRVKLIASGSGEPVPAALVRVVLPQQDPQDEVELLGIGMSVMRDDAARELARLERVSRRWTHFDVRLVGEASIPVVGLSASIWSENDDEVTLDAVPALIEVLPLSGNQHLPDPASVVTAPAEPSNQHPIAITLGEELLAQALEVTL